MNPPRADFTPEGLAERNGGLLKNKRASNTT